MEKIELKISTEYIQLNQLLKYADIISSGGEAKFFIQDNEVLYNGELETRLRKKVYNQDEITINDELLIVVMSDISILENSK